MMKYRLLIFCVVVPCIGYAQFVERSKELFVDHTYTHPILMGGGVAVLDANNDGLLDVYMTSGLEQSDELLINAGNYKYYNYADSSSLGAITLQLATFGVVSGDINNDGCEDLFITTLSSSQPNLLLKGNCNGKFEDISASAGIIHSAESTAATMTDVNKDGYLDIYVVNYIKENKFLYDNEGNVNGYAHDCYANFFYINNGDGTFTESAAEMSADNDGCGLAVTAFDFDNDGVDEIYIANDFGEWVKPNALLDYDGTIFIDRAAETGLDVAIYGMGIAIGDVEQDGDHDVYVTNIGKNALMINDGNTFINQSDSAGVDNTLAEDGSNTTGWGTLLFDYDNDADLDLFVANGYIPVAPFIGNTLFDHNKFYVNTNDGFSDVSANSGVNSDRINRGAAYGDLDNDGDLDIITSTAAKSQEQNESLHSFIYINEIENGNNWLQLQLKGVESNLNAYGARLEAFWNANKTVIYNVSGTSHASQNSSIIQIGIRQTESIDSVKIIWPSGIIETKYDLPVNNRIFVEETTAGYEIIGCMDPSSVSFNENATIPAKCFYNKIYGCMDNSAINYNPYANESDNSCEYDEVITGQLDQEKGKAISVFPNPFSDYININGIGSEYEFVDIKIYDNKGVLVEELHNRSGNDRINTTNLSEGLYYLVVLSNDLQLIKTFKIHKQQ